MTTQDSTYGSPEASEEEAGEATGRHAGEGRIGATAADPEALDDGGTTLLPVDAEPDAAATRTGATDYADYDLEADPRGDLGREAALAGTPATPDTGVDAGGRSESGAGGGYERTTDLTGDVSAAGRDEAFAGTPATPGAAAAPVSDTGAVATPEPADASSTATGTGPAASGEAWRELQSHFVDDPADAVRQAGQLVEQALADLRSHLESGSTEDLRTAFRRYRDLHSSLT